MSAAATSILAALAVALGAGLGLAVTAAPAAAHTDFLGADPEDGATVDGLPGAIRLEFSDPMDPSLSTVVLRSGDGDNIKLELASGVRPGVLVATVPVSLSPDDGTTTRWTVSFRVVSRDGHPVVGTTKFVVRAPKAEPAPDPSSTPSAETSEPAATSAAAGASGSDDSAASGGNGWLIVVGVGVLALLGLGAAAVMRLAGRDPDA